MQQFILQLTKDYVIISTSFVQFTLEDNLQKDNLGSF